MWGSTHSPKMKSHMLYRLNWQVPLLNNSSNTDCVGFYCTPSDLPIVRTPTGCPAIKFNSDINYVGLVQALQVQGLVPQDCPPTSDISPKFQAVIYALDQLAIN